MVLPFQFSVTIQGIAPHIKPGVDLLELLYLMMSSLALQMLSRPHDASSSTLMPAWIPHDTPGEPFVFSLWLMMGLYHI